jgi:hypothetical protein
MSPPLAESELNYDIGMDLDEDLHFEPDTFALDPQEAITALPATSGFFGGTEQLSNVGYNVPDLGNLPIDLDGMSWPWLHETLFLQNDPFAGLFDDAAPQQDHSHEASMGGNPGGPALAIADGEASIPSPTGDGQAAASTDPGSVLAAEADALIGYATNSGSEEAIRAARQSHWRAASSRLEAVFFPNFLDAAQDRDGDHLLRRIVLSDYMPKFNRLWPMFSRYQFDPDALNPMLYLVLVSIGSMYGSVSQKHFGTLLHTRLRRLLAGSSFDLEHPEGDMIWLAHARLLTQVQGLYFGQKQGFSYAQVCVMKFENRSNCLLTAPSTLAHC